MRRFYDPEIVGDTPESVEFRGMQNLLTALGGRLGGAKGKVGGWVGWGLAGRGLDTVWMGAGRRRGVCVLVAFCGAACPGQWVCPLGQINKQAT